MTASPPPSASTARVPSTIDGDRVVRVLSAGERAVTALVHADGVTRVARVIDANLPDALIDAEIAVHDAVRRAPAALREHVAAVDDLVTLPDGRLAILLEQVVGPPLEAVLTARRGRLELGEAVTLLAPLAEALEAAHGVGLSGLGLAASDIRLRESGAPVVVRLQDARVGPVLPERLRDREPAYAADRAALARLGEGVAAALAEPGRAALLSAMRRATLECALAPALFDLADPLPVRLDVVSGDPEGTAARDEPTVPAPLSTAQPAAHSDPGTGSTRVPAWLQASLDAVRSVGLPEGIVAAVESAALGLVARWGTGIVRPRFLLAGAAGAGALVLALVVGASSSSDEAVVGDPLLGPDAIAADAPAPENGEAPEVALHPAADEWQAIVEVLVGRWTACRALTTGVSDANGDADGEVDAGAVDCVATIVHPGSAAELLLLTADPRHALLERWSAARGEAVVVERMGGAVLVDLVTAGTPTASLLIVRSEAGWRVRDVIG